MPASLANCTKIDEFNIEGNNVSELPVRTFRLYCQKIVFYKDLEREISNETVIWRWKRDQSESLTRIKPDPKALYLHSFLPSCNHSYNASLLGEQQSSPIPTILWLFSQSNSTLQHCWNSFSTILCLISTLVSMETILMEQMFLYLILLIELLRLPTTFECDFRDILISAANIFLLILRIIFFIAWKCWTMSPCPGITLNISQLGHPSNLLQFK